MICLAHPNLIFILLTHIFMSISHQPGAILIIFRLYLLFWISLLSSMFACSFLYSSFWSFYEQYVPEIFTATHLSAICQFKQSSQFYQHNAGVQSLLMPVVIFWTTNSSPLLKKEKRRKILYILGTKTAIFLNILCLPFFPIIQSLDNS